MSAWRPWAGDARLRSAVKADDGFFTTFFVSPYSPYIARWAARRALTPNQVTVASMVIGGAAAVAFATGTRAGLVGGAVLLQCAFIADCVDGQLARYTQTFSPFGGWLDSMFDRGKEYAVFAGLAAGGVRMGDEGIWLLALIALAVQTMRHTLDAAYHAREPAATSARPSLLAAAGQAAIGASSATERRGWSKWPKRIVAFPVGERFAVISLTAAITDARTTFIVVLAWTAVAVAYTATGRLLRSAT